MSTESRWYEDDLEEVLFDEIAIARRVQEMGEEITKSYQKVADNNEKIILVGLLKGSYMFLSDLSKTIDLPIVVDVMTVRSYSGNRSTGSIKLLKDLDIDPKGAHVLICEDLVDTGTTLTWLMKHLESKETASVKLCTFIRKNTKRRTNDIKIDFCGYECKDKFIVGYGMDYDELYRNIPVIGVLREKIYSSEKDSLEEESKVDKYAI